jgi:hypothetical protein
MSQNIRVLTLMLLLSAGTVCRRIMLLAFRQCKLSTSVWSSNYHKPWNINIFLLTSYKVLPEFPFSLPSYNSLQNSWDLVHMGTWYHRHWWRCTRTTHRVLFRLCWTVSDLADTARPPSAVRCRLVWDIAGRLQRFRGISTRSLRDVELTAAVDTKHTPLQWIWSRRNTTVDMEQTEYHCGYGADWILLWIWSRLNTAVDMEQTEYYCGYGSDWILLWIWSRLNSTVDLEQGADGVLQWLWRRRSTTVEIEQTDHCCGHGTIRSFHGC